MILVLYK